MDGRVPTGARMGTGVRLSGALHMRIGILVSFWSTPVASVTAAIATEYKVHTCDAPCPASYPFTCRTAVRSDHDRHQAGCMT